MVVSAEDFMIRVLVRPKLAKDYFDMKKKLNEELECPICLEKICCRKCFTLLNCGHSFCGECFMAQESPTCAVCRFGQA